MNIMQFLASNWDSVLLVAAVIAGVIILYRRGEIAMLENLLFTLVIQAEREFGSGTGELKKATVIQCAYEYLPKIATLFISRQTLERLLEAALDYAKKQWATNPYLWAEISGESPEESVPY